MSGTLTGGRVCAFAVLVALQLRPQSALAQTVAALEVGASRVAHDDAVAAGAASLNPSLRWDGASASLAIDGAWARIGGRSSGRVSAGASVFGPTLAGARAEIAAALVATRLTGATTSFAAGSLRAHRGGGTLGVWVGGSGGRTDDGDAARGLLGVEAGAWVAGNAARLAVTAAHTRVGNDIRYSDLAAAARLDRGRLEAGGYVSLRGGAESETGALLSAGMDATLWLSDHVAATASGGTFAPDPGQGLAGGRFAQIGLRLATRRPDRSRHVVNRRLPSLAEPTAGRLESRTVADGRRELRIRAPGATRVEIMGDFTGWEPVVLASDGGGTWTHTLTLPAGTYRLNVRVDGGEWGIPADAAATADEFGGATAIVHIE